MPGTEVYPPRRSQTHGISKNRNNKKTPNGKRPHITIHAVIQHSAPSPISDALAISRQCTPTPAPPAQVQQFSQAVPPPQVVLFYDHINGNSPSQRSHEEAVRHIPSFRHEMSTAREKLQALLPPKEDVVRIARYADQWMAIYHGLHSLTYTFRTGFQLIATHDRMQNSEVHPVLLSMYLLCIAISSQHVPRDVVIGDLSRSEYVPEVCNIVEEVIVKKSILAGTVEGLETCLLLLMVAVGRNDLTTIVHTLERLLSLAELMGLPRAAHDRVTSQQPQKFDPHLQAKLRVWEAICTVDRNFGMMLRLPVSTTNSIYPLYRFVWRNNDPASVQLYNYYLAKICGMVYAIEKIYANGDVDEAEAYKKVSTTSHALQNLAASVPKQWLHNAEGKTTDLIVKFWHPYITVRAHLKPATLPGEQYRHDRRIVRKSCAEALKMFCSFRTSMHDGFFYCRVLDIQAFTCAILLLLIEPDGDPETIECERDMINRALATYKLAASEGTSNFVRKAVNGISSLQNFSEGLGNAATTTVHIPLLGNVRIERREPDTMNSAVQTPLPFDTPIEELLSASLHTSTNHIFFSIDFEQDSAWTPPASRAGGYGRD